jgi:selenocysteine-specific elongation factor
MHVIGTAGHVDHGKSTLVAALTGINPDRLKEEREREMTIDLGFAWVTLPDGDLVGIVDVPGHRDFIENMLAGVGGIDAALFVVAADEGIMPQTREHLAILDILQVQAGVIVLTKVDLIDDPEWLSMIEEEVRHATRGTVLADVPIVRVSARTGAGLQELKYALIRVLGARPARTNLGRPRLPVDRVFTIQGFGTVITGTLVDGELHSGDEIEILPSGLRGRIRGLQTYKQKEETALPGSRTAVNISGISVEQVARGNVAVFPGVYRPTRLLDVRFRLLADASGPVRHNQELKLFLGTSETLARVRLLGSEELKPGEEGWLQLEMEQPVVAVKGDHYILRRPSPGETLGGGEIVEPHPKSRYKRFSEEVLARLEALSFGTPSEMLLQALVAAGIVPLREAVERSRLDQPGAKQAIQDLVLSDQLVAFEPGELRFDSPILVMARQTWQQVSGQAVDEVTAYHQLYPLRRGMPREQLKSRLKVQANLFSLLIKKCVLDGLIVETGAILFQPGREIILSTRQQEQVSLLLERFASSPYSPPSIKECQAELGDDLYTVLVENGQLVPVSDEVVFRSQEYKSMLAEVSQQLKTDGTLTVGQFRDRYNTSRRYALAFLEHLDAVGVTTRQGDVRRLAGS